MTDLVAAVLPHIDEAQRLQALLDHHILDTAEETEFDDLTRLAAEMCGTPMALVSLVAADRQWFKSKLGMDICSTSRDVSFCAHALNRRSVLVVPDAQLDPRFATNPQVLGAPFLRFYAGAPLITAEGHVLGTLCVLDTVPRVLTELQLSQLSRLARQVMSQLQLRRQAAELAAEVRAREAADQARRQNQRLLEGVLAATDSMVFAKDLRGHFLLANQALHTMLGLPAGGLIGRNEQDVFPSAAVEAFHLNDTEIVASGQTRSFTETLPQPDGTVRHFQSTKFPLRDADGVIYAVAGASTDVTALREQLRISAESEERWKALFAGSPVGIGLSDENERIVAVNAAMCTLLGRPESEVVGHPNTEFNHPDDAVAQRAAARELRDAPDGVVQLEKRYRRPDGTVRWAWLTVTTIDGPAGQVWRLSHVQDITDRKAAEQLISDSEANLHAVARVIQSIQHGSDARQTVVDAARELAAAGSVSLVEPVGTDGSLQVSASTDPDVVGTALPQASATAEVFRSGEALFLADPASDSRVVPSLLAIRNTRSMYSVPVSSAGQITAVLVVTWRHRVADLDNRHASVVTLLADQAGVALRQAALMAELTSLASTDPLTGLSNRRDWDRTLTRLLHTAKRTGRPLTVALADLDHFKLFNDRFGHPAGDDLLRGFARSAPAALRSDDVVARWGGEEFALALPACSGDEAPAVLTRVQEAVPDGQTCSIGYATWDGRETAGELLTRVDRALYEAKDSGRNRLAAG